MTVYIEEQEYENVDLRKLYESSSLIDKLQCFKRTVDVKKNDIDLIVCLGGDGMSITNLILIFSLILIYRN